MICKLSKLFVLLIRLKNIAAVLVVAILISAFCAAIALDVSIDWGATENISGKILIAITLFH